MYLTAETVTVDEDDGRFTLVIEDDEGKRHAFIIHHIDLDAFYDQVKGRIGPYLREMHEAQVAHGAQRRAEYDRVFACNPDESGEYDTSDPKHPRYHSTHADIWDSREGK